MFLNLNSRGAVSYPFVLEEGEEYTTRAGEVKKARVGEIDLVGMEQEILTALTPFDLDQNMQAELTQYVSGMVEVNLLKGVATIHHLIRYAVRQWLEKQTKCIWDVPYHTFAVNALFPELNLTWLELSSARSLTRWASNILYGKATSERIEFNEQDDTFLYKKIGQTRDHLIKNIILQWTITGFAIYNRS